jgi:hypothetical protein
MYGLIGTAKLNGVDSETWLRHVLERIAGIPSTGARLPALEPDCYTGGHSHYLSRPRPDSGSIISSSAHGKTDPDPYPPRQHR